MKTGDAAPVLLLAPEMVVRGGSLYVVDLAVELARREVPTVVVSPGGPMVARLTEKGITHRAVPFQGGRILDPIGLWRLRRAGREIQPRLVHVLSESLTGSARCWPVCSACPPCSPRTVSADPTSTPSWVLAGPGSR
jgi:hypothetical protein